MLKSGLRPKPNRSPDCHFLFFGLGLEYFTFRILSVKETSNSLAEGQVIGPSIQHTVSYQNKFRLSEIIPVRYHLSTGQLYQLRLGVSLKKSVDNGQPKISHQLSSEIGFPL